MCCTINSCSLFTLSLWTRHPGKLVDFWISINIQNLLRTLYMTSTYTHGSSLNYFIFTLVIFRRSTYMWYASMVILLQDGSIVFIHTLCSLLLPYICLVCDTMTQSTNGGLSLPRVHYKRLHLLSWHFFPLGSLTWWVESGRQRAGLLWHSDCPWRSTCSEYRVPDE